MNLNIVVCEMGVIIIAIAEGCGEDKISGNSSALAHLARCVTWTSSINVAVGLEPYYVTYREMMKQQWFGKGKS